MRHIKKIKKFTINLKIEKDSKDYFDKHNDKTVMFKYNNISVINN